MLTVAISPSVMDTKMHPPWIVIVGDGSLLNGSSNPISKLR